MFRKLAGIKSLGAAELTSDGLRKIASASPTARVAQIAPARSYYLDGARTIPVGALLEKVASEYAISPDPRDYIYEAIRANTSNAPNENNDGFHQFELLRWDTRLGMTVFKTYVGKPHHVNHKADNPRAARGVIIDAHYNDETPALENCPRCSLHTAMRGHRDASGLHCKRCGHLIKDEFPEILIGVDVKKDPRFAHGVKTGALPAGSMGCNCLNTACNVCQHVAYSRPEFCEHIRAGSKGSLWQRRGSVWARTSISDVEREVRRRGMNWDPVDFCYVTHDGFEVRKAFEYCQNVVFDEYSRVDQPADPKALQREILRTARTQVSSLGVPSPEELSAETDALLRAASARRTAGRTAMKFTVIRVNRDNADVHAAESLEAACSAAGVDPADGSVEFCEVEATDAEAAALMFNEAEAKPASSARDADVVVQAPPNEPIVIEPPGSGGAGQPGTPGQPGQPPGAPTPTIDDLQNPQKPPTPSGPGGGLSPAEMGMMPPGASAPRRAQQRSPMRFANSYRGWSVEVSPKGNARVFTANKAPVLVIRGEPESDPQRRHARGVEIMRSILTHGLFATAVEHKAIATPKLAQVVDGAIDDMKEFADKYTQDSTRDDADDDMDGDLRGSPPDSATQGGETDMPEDARGTPPKDTQDDGIRDHKNEGKPPKSVTQEDNTDMADKPRGKTPKNVLVNELHDHTEKLAALTRPGATIAHKSKPTLGWTVRVAEAKEDGSLEVTVAAANYAPRRVTQQDLITYWQTFDRTAAAPASEPAWTPLQVQRLRDFGINAELEHGQLVVKQAAAPATDDGEKKARAVFELRLKKAAQAREAKLKQDHEKELEQARLAGVSAFCRALRIAARRQDAGLEPSILRQAAEQTFGAPRQLVDASGQPVAYPGMDPLLVRHLVAELAVNAHPQHLENVMNRAADLMAKGDEYLLDAEADAQRFQPQLPAITAANVQPVDQASIAAMQYQAAAVQGNFAVAPQPAYEEVAQGGVGFDKRSAIRGAVAGTLTSMNLQRLRAVN